MGFKNGSQIAVNIKHREDLKHTSKTQMVRKCKLTEGLFFFLENSEFRATKQNAAQRMTLKERNKYSYAQLAPKFWVQRVEALKKSDGYLARKQLNEFKKLGIVLSGQTLPQHRRPLSQ